MSLRPAYSFSAPVLARAALFAAIVFAAGPLAAAPGDQPVNALLPTPQQPAAVAETRTASLPARGLFAGDRLTDAAKARLAELIIEAIGLQVEVALIIPTGPWQIDGSGAGERDLTPARLQSVRRYLTDRGVDPKRLFVESRTDARISEPRLEVQLVAKPASD